MGTTLFFLGLVFVVLKLGGAIHFAWVWVLMPWWIGLAATAIFWTGVGAVLCVLAGWLPKRGGRW